MSSWGKHFKILPISKRIASNIHDEFMARPLLISKTIWIAEEIFFKFFSTPDRSLFEKKILRKFRYDFFHQFLPRCLQEFPKELFVRFFSRFPSRIRLGIQSEITGNFPSEISPALAQDFSRKSSRDSSSDSFRDFLRILSEFLQKFLPKFSRKSFQDCRIPLRVAFVIPQREFAEIRQLFRNHL